MQEQFIDQGGGLKIFLRTWRPKTGHPRGVVAIVPGFKSHSGHYGWVAESLVAAGFAVYAVDLRGRGRSDGERFFVESFDDYAKDAATLVATAKAGEPGLPVFLLGHSAGGVVACLYALDHQRELAGLVCESFAYELPAPDLALAAFKGLSHVAPHVPILKLKNADFSRDPAVVAAMDADPLLAGEVQPIQTLAAMVRADERLKAGFPTLTLPLLILHGTADKAAKASGSQHFLELAGSRDKTLKLYEGGYHDLLNDTGKQTVLADIQKWLEGHLATR